MWFWNNLRDFFIFSWIVDFFRGPRCNHNGPLDNIYPPMNNPLDNIYPPMNNHTPMHWDNPRHHHQAPMHWDDPGYNSGHYNSFDSARNTGAYFPDNSFMSSDSTSRGPYHYDPMDHLDDDLMDDFL